MRAILIILIVFAVGFGSAQAAHIWLRGSNGYVSGAHGPPAPGSNLLLEDGASSLLLEDGASNLCLESGC